MSNINEKKTVAEDCDGGPEKPVTTATARNAADIGVYQESEHDKIIIADEVIAQIVLIAISRISGISLPSSGVGDGIAGFLGMKGPSRGIRVDSDEKSVKVDITISVDYGKKINEIAKTLQDEIRNDLTYMTGLDVAHVNVNVTSMNAKEQPAAKPAKASKAQLKESVTDETAVEGAKTQVCPQEAAPVPASAFAPTSTPAATPTAAASPAPTSASTSAAPAPAPAPTSTSTAAPASAPGSAAAPAPTSTSAATPAPAPAATPTPASEQTQ